MDQLHLINVFVAVVDTNGFAGAARKLNISPPAVTRAINELESHLGVRLLTRTTRVVRVTEAGARYGEDCRRILAELAEADQSASGAHGSPHGRLTLTAPVLFGCKFVTPIVTEYLQRYPEVSAACWFLDRRGQHDGRRRRRGRAHWRPAGLVNAGHPRGHRASGDLRCPRLSEATRHPAIPR